MFYRNAIEELREWANRYNRKPLILRGTRQVGKTTLVDEFGKDFEIYLKLDLEEPEHIQLFENYINIV
jgi:predicted AAA+ superfamily ATPase